ncbi:hypothetical protein Q9R19_09855 [Microbacterium sp. ARD32]|uniref:hypothetical protein n=1 Tax=Microbacterium sp. ARD32 TaxID=2962577 RepID=UPI002880D046|nr:hypothetical protein [Microbacterium sp. ARD32]MDT0157927.1 hypothetical protein [Microbacterium sp. ARD32]
MHGIDPQKLGRWSLRLDAAYCAVLGIAVAACSGMLADSIRLPAPLIAAVGVAVILWAALVAWMLVRLQLRAALRVVLIVNMIAVAAVAAASMLASTPPAGLGVVTVAVDVALFAVSQAIALRAGSAASHRRAQP